MTWIRSASYAIGLLALALLLATPVDAQGKAPAAKGNAGANPVQVQVAVYPGDAMRALPREAVSFIPVVIFGAANFDVGTVNTETLALTAHKLELSRTNGKSACHTEDVNRDGRVDLVCTIQSSANRAKPGTSVVEVEGRTFDGVRFHGEFTLQLLPGPPARPAPAKH